MSFQTWLETVFSAPASGTAVTNTTTETIVFPNVTIPANYLTPGRRLRLRAFGTWATTAATPTLVFKVRWGGVAGTLITQTAAITTVTSTTSAMWDLEVILSTRAVGTTGSILGWGVFRAYAGVAGTIASATGEALVTPFGSAGILAPAAVTIDTTADTALALTVTWGTANAANTITGLDYSIESMN